MAEFDTTSVAMIVSMAPEHAETLERLYADGYDLRMLQLEIDGVGGSVRMSVDGLRTVVTHSPGEAGNASAVNRAIEDARILGSGYLRVSPTAQFERLDPISVVLRD